MEAAVRCGILCAGALRRYAVNTSHSNRNAFVAAALFALAAAALSTCLPAQAAQDEGEGDDGGKREAGPPDGDPRGGVVVALKHEIGSPDIYKCTYSRSQEGADKYQEKGTFALKFETLGRTPEGYDRCAEGAVLSGFVQ